jgi:hypothetical protein
LWSGTETVRVVDRRRSRQLVRLPASPMPITQDRIGANVDDSAVANADDTGRTTDAPRDEVRPLK